MSAIQIAATLTMGSDACLAAATAFNALQLEWVTLSAKLQEHKIQQALAGLNFASFRIDTIIRKGKLSEEEFASVRTRINLQRAAITSFAQTNSVKVAQ